MTTIAVKDGVMAADTRVTDSGPYGHTFKIQRIGTLSIAGMCGDAYLGLVVLEWLKSKRNPAVLQKTIPADHRYEVEVVELYPGGIQLWNGWGHALRINDTTWAVGSGAMAALAQMNAGATAVDAVKAAIGLDEASGLPIQVEYLKPPKTFPNEFKRPTRKRKR